MTDQTRQALIENAHAQEIALANRQFKFLFELITDRILLENRADAEDMAGVK